MGCHNPITAGWFWLGCRRGKQEEAENKASDKILKQLYGLYKESAIGDIDIKLPGMLDLKDKAKWEAWNLQKRLSKADATSSYISKAKELVFRIQRMGNFPFEAFISWPNI